MTVGCHAGYGLRNLAWEGSSEDNNCAVAKDSWTWIKKRYLYSYTAC